MHQILIILFSLENSFACHWPDCGKVFSRTTSLYHHYRSHTETRNYPCPVCGKTFFRPGHLAKHVKGHSNNIPEERPKKRDSASSAEKKNKHSFR